MTLTSRGSLIAFAATGAVLVVAAVVIAIFMSNDTSAALVREHGPVENLSVGLYLVGVIVFVGLFLSKGLRHYWYIPAVLLALASREASAHRLLLGDQSSKQLFNMSADISLAGRVLVVILAVIVLLALFKLLARHFTQFWKKLAQFDHAAMAVFLALSFAGMSQFFDKFSAKAAEFGIILTPDDKHILWVFEEVTEIGIGAFLIFAIIYARPSRQATHKV
ncbi:hypothetical protein MNBD_GAMMA16-1040 [hydrothermal vent metagenome]|uniref:Uncharacterized protein n=1 Tax=hydrothermal vent metagenome TaxID=652676 RepID=A0A3B0ZHV8_9ZZZZ